MPDRNERREQLRWARAFRAVWARYCQTNGQLKLTPELGGLADELRTKGMAPEMAAAALYMGTAAAEAQMRRMN